MLVNLEDFQHFNGFYKRPYARGVVFKMYSSHCQVCGGRIQSLSDMWVGHRTPRSHREVFERLVKGLIDIDNLMNLQPEHKDCNRKKSNIYVLVEPLFQSALDVAAKEVSSLSLHELSNGSLGLELNFDLSSAVRDGPDAEWLWLSLDATENIVHTAFIAAATGLPDAYLPRSRIPSVVFQAVSTDAAMVEFDLTLEYVGKKDSALSKFVSVLWDREATTWRNSRRSVKVPGQPNGWYVLPQGTDLTSLHARVFSPEHRAAMNLQRFSRWIQSGQSSKSGGWVCKGIYANVWSSLYNEFHSLVYELGPLASFEVANGRAKLHAHCIDADNGNLARDSFRRLFAEDENFRKGQLEDGDYELFDRAAVRSFLRKKERKIKGLANAPSSQQGDFAAEGPCSI